MNVVVEPQREVPVVQRVDVVVAGGGPAGFAAALAAARNGATVLLVERYGFLGGMSSAGYVILLPLWLLGPFGSEGRSLLGGIAQEIVEVLEEMGGSVKPGEAYTLLKQGRPLLPYQPAWIPHDFEMMKMAMLRMLRRAGVRLRLHSLAVGAVKDGQHVTGVIVESKSGREAILADVTIDATGDGDIAFAAGASCEQTKGGEVLPVTLPFYLGNVDIDRVQKYLKQDSGLKRVLKEKGRAHFSAYSELAFQLTQVLQGRSIDSEAELSLTLSLQLIHPPAAYPPRYDQLLRYSELGVWGAHSFGRDITDVQDLTEAEMETRERAMAIADFLRKYVPGFERAYLATTATQIGTRESRRILGDYLLTAADVQQGRRFSDVIARSQKGEWDPAENEKNPAFDIPYRCLLPRGLEGILVAGRCISMDHQAATFLSPRDISTCMATGEAAGTAAASAVQNKVKPRALSIAILRSRLQKQGVNLGGNSET
ncbi:MAG: FAD-dependent oxidoreductase [Chloroflexi bacterium]|nr:FAD-dependent oxidoreductase [Chloroflexota bacterium]MCL5075884.1 FAD-dependent oxidoreductase [Chloroflexota bacterium]